jgi:UDP-glucuronate decarboxylase
MKRILITGGVGFLGFHLSKKLLSAGNEVIALDNLSTSRKANLQELERNSGFKFIAADVTNPFYEEVDQIYNLACPASPVHYQSDPISTIKTSIIGAINALELATKLDVPVLQASTSEVYGDPQIHPQIEDYWGNVNPIGLRSCYDEGKRASETLFNDYHRAKGTKIKIARIFNTYGPNMQIRDGRVVSNFIVQALRNEPITIYGEGTQTRSFCFVEDLIVGLVELMNSSEGVIGPVNFGNPEEVTMTSLAETIVELTNSESQITKTSLPSDDPLRRNPDITKAKNLFDWGPNYTLRAGLTETIPYFRRELSTTTF